VNEQRSDGARAHSRVQAPQTLSLPLPTPSPTPQVSSIFDNNLVTGQSQSGLWFGTTDDLWSFGKPQGWGGPWRYDVVEAETPSDPYLMTGFDHKVVHMRVDPPFPPGVTAVNVKVQVRASRRRVLPAVPHAHMHVHQGRARRWTSRAARVIVARTSTWSRGTR